MAKTGLMSANINMESFDTLVMSIIAENQVIIKRKELGLFTQKLIELDSDIQEIVSCLLIF